MVKNAWRSKQQDFDWETRVFLLPFFFLCVQMGEKRTVPILPLYLLLACSLFHLFDVALAEIYVSIESRVLVNLCKYIAATNRGRR